MPGFLDSSEIEIPCENCGRKTKKSIEWIKSHRVLACTCGTRMKLNTSQFKSDIAKVERSLTDLLLKK
jgi:uncharacterized Zn finger protein